jgi:hypothetical protein
MASYALLGALAGFRYSAAKQTLWFDPQLSVRPFKTFFCTATGFGTISLDARTLRIQMLEGELPLENLVMANGSQASILEWKTTVRPKRPRSKHLNSGGAFSQVGRALSLLGNGVNQSLAAGHLKTPPPPVLRDHVPDIAKASS